MKGRETDETVATSRDTARGGARPASSVRAAAITLGLLAVYAWTASRSLRSPNPYSIGHWLQSYEHGFIKRGLLGNLVRPMLSGKGPGQVGNTIEVASFVVFALFSLAMIASAVMVVRRDRQPVAPLAALVLLGSPFIVFSAHLVGYFDLLVATFGIFSVYLVARSRWLAAGLCSGVAILVHEMYAVAAMPMVALCAGLQLVRIDGRGRWRSILELLTVPTLAFAAVMVSTFLHGDEVVLAIREDIAARGVLDAYWVDMSTYHLKHGFVENLQREYRFGWSRIRNQKMAIVVLPALVWLLLAGAAKLYRSHRTPWIPIYVMAALSPWLMHWVAWDTQRIAILPIFGAFLGYFGFCMLFPARPDSRPLPQWTVSTMFALGLCAAAASAWTEVPLMDDQRDGRGPFSIRLESTGCGTGAPSKQ